ncbi:MAG: hypothetical protein BWX93_01541 [Bacteroidetes bacterium ADurb.Bin139]|nr:MAG: hypothetical protein BWX93_01541 [Bacteroidetes bacterium ADurb.Bin139]HOZ20053.1 hypothetical protein [Bacteroidales bacterium]HPB78422.1 hypothetical protein [Bacteroidales bacterium]HPK39908.1 hypothetical protein [Bacteroidales bacterium]HQN82621.1 hypothetical protein [Bacteroidales bacterium]
MKNILIVLALILTACGTTARITWEGVKPLINTEDSVQLYEFQMIHVNGVLEGLILVKKNNLNRPHLVLTSYFSLSLFDLEGTAEGYKVNYVIDVLDRRSVLDLLWDDFSMLIDPSAWTGFRPVADDQGNILLMTTGTGIRSTVIKAADHANGYPASIVIEHPALRLSVYLKVLQDAQGSIYH